MLIVLSGQHHGLQSSVVRNSGSGTAPNPSSVGSGGDAADILWTVVLMQEGTAAINAYPTDYTLYQNSVTSTNPSRITLCARELNALSQDPSAFSLAVSNSYLVFTIAVRPVAEIALTPIEVAVQAPALDPRIPVEIDLEPLMVTVEASRLYPNIETVDVRPRKKYFPLHPFPVRYRERP
jgi:hypothetical protein